MVFIGYILKVLFLWFNRKGNVIVKFIKIVYLVCGIKIFWWNFYVGKFE